MGTRDLFIIPNPELSSNGKTIFLTEADIPERQLLRFKSRDIESGQEKVLYELPVGRRAMSVQLSPDEQMIAWVESQSGTPPSSDIKPVGGQLERSSD